MEPASRTLPVGVRLAWPVAAAACARVSRGEMPPQSGTAVPAPAPGHGLSPRLLPGPRGLAQMSLRSLTLRPPLPAARAASGQRGSAAAALSAAGTAWVCGVILWVQLRGSPVPLPLERRESGRVL